MFEFHARHVIELLEVRRYDRHNTNKLRGKTVCAQKRNCAKCGALLKRKEHECFKPYCEYCNANKEIGHLCYMRPLVNILPSGNDVLFVFYDFETTQDSKFTDCLFATVLRAVRDKAGHRYGLYALW